MFVNCKRFDNDTSLFSLINGIQTIPTNLSSALYVTSNWAFQWKIIFNLDLTKESQEAIFIRKIKILLRPPLLFNNIPLNAWIFSRIHNSRLNNNIAPINVRHHYFKNSFFLSTISEWNKLDLRILNSATFSIFKKNLLNFSRTLANILDIHNPYWIKLLTHDCA